MTARRLGVLAAATIVVVAMNGSAALAHEGEESGKAGDLVRQAIALIVNTPNDIDAITDKVVDALEAEDTDGVDLAEVQQARAALEDGDLHRTRALLEASIGAQPHVPLEVAEPPPIGETTPTTTAGSGMGTMAEPEPSDESSGMDMATGAEPGDSFVAEPLDARPSLDGGDWAVLLASVALGFVGLWLGLRYRPTRARPA